MKVWSIGQPTPNFTLEGHEKGVNCVDYLAGGDRPYLISADDKLVKMGLPNEIVLQTLDGHSHNVSAVAFHPVADHHHRQRRRDVENLAPNDVQVGKHFELRLRASLGDQVIKGSNASLLVTTKDGHVQGWERRPGGEHGR